MKTLIINKNNWSGEEAGIKIGKTVLKVFGCFGSESWETFKINKTSKNTFEVTNKNFKQAVCYGYFDNDYVSVYKGCYYKIHSNKENAIFIIVAQLIFNCF